MSVRPSVSCSIRLSLPTSKRPFRSRRTVLPGPTRPARRCRKARPRGQARPSWSTRTIRRRWREGLLRALPRATHPTRLLSGVSSVGRRTVAATFECLLRFSFAFVSYLFLLHLKRPADAVSFVAGIPTIAFGYHLTSADGCLCFPSLWSFIPPLPSPLLHPTSSGSFRERASVKRNNAQQ